MLALGERECSVQRRHQKVLEESPSTALDPGLRAAMSDAAVRFAAAIGYVGAGTAEFVLEGREFFFLELNGRIQVEHPVTEEVTGIDLVQWQLRIARGERLELAGDTPAGHAVEVRLYAEDPRTFLPQAGRVEVLRLPASVRVETGVAEGDEIGTSYDPMIAKLIASGATRDEALDRLAAALAETTSRALSRTCRSCAGSSPTLPCAPARRRRPSSPTTRRSRRRRPPLPDPVWRLLKEQRAFRLNLPAPAPLPAPDIDSAASTASAAADGPRTVSAPMPGTVIKVNVQQERAVLAGQPLVVLEAMKMETPLASPYDATVRAVHVQEGDRVTGARDLAGRAQRGRHL